MRIDVERTEAELVLDRLGEGDLRTELGKVGTDEGGPGTPLLDGAPRVRSTYHRIDAASIGIRGFMVGAVRSRCERGVHLSMTLARIGQRSAAVAAQSSSL